MVFMATTPPKTLDLDTLKSFAIRFENLKADGLLTHALTFEQLNDALDEKQQEVVQQILALRPSDYGVGTPFVGLEPVPADLVVVSGQKYTDASGIQIIGDKLVPHHIHESFVRMNKAFRIDYPDRALLIESCYRSPAAQVVAFINWCSSAYGGDVTKTIRHASPPAYSQHTNASKAAIDVKTVDGSPSNDHPEDFKETVEYKWLRKNASKFGFYESWLVGNEFGMRAEPWHWQFRGVH